jgi:hypothetical protein
MFKAKPPPPHLRKTIVTPVREPVVIVEERDLAAQRRARYQQDEEHRQRVLIANRRNRRAKNPDVYQMDGKEAERRLDIHASIINVRKPTGMLVDAPILSIRGLSIVLGRDYNTIINWIKRELLPAPVLTVTSGLHSGINVYHREEIAVVIGELTRHFRGVARYNQTHVTTIDRIKAAVGSVRASLKYEDKG